MPVRKRPMHMKQTSVLLALLLVLGACGAADDVASDEAVDQSTVPAATAEETTTSTTRLDVELVPATTKVPLTVPPAGGSPEAPVFEPGDDPVAFAIADLAVRLGVAEVEIELVDQQEVMWRDGSIGCPQPGFSYTQALVDGSRIVLSYDGVTYSYHQGRGRAPFWCENPAE